MSTILRPSGPPVNVEAARAIYEAARARVDAFIVPGTSAECEAALDLLAAEESAYETLVEAALDRRARMRFTVAGEFSTDARYEGGAR